MARIIRRHGGGRILRRSREEKRRLSEGGGGASQQPQGPAEDDYCPVIGSKINMDGISDQEVANAYSFVFSFDEALRSIKLEEGRLLIHIADLYEMKRSLDDKITSLKAAVKSSPSADILRRIKSTRTKNNETQEEIYADKSLLAKTRLKLVKLEVLSCDPNLFTLNKGQLLPYGSSSFLGFHHIYTSCKPPCGDVTSPQI